MWLKLLPPRVAGAFLLFWTIIPIMTDHILVMIVIISDGYIQSSTMTIITSPNFDINTFWSRIIHARNNYINTLIISLKKNTPINSQATPRFFQCFPLK